MDTKEMWQINIGGQIYEADFEAMTQWILEGSLLPQDKVRLGNLRWIEARKVPALVPIFSALERRIRGPFVTFGTNLESFGDLVSTENTISCGEVS